MLIPQPLKKALKQDKRDPWRYDVKRKYVVLDASGNRIEELRADTHSRRMQAPTLSTSYCFDDLVGMEVYKYVNPRKL